MRGQNREEIANQVEDIFQYSWSVKTPFLLGEEKAGIDHNHDGGRKPPSELIPNIGSQDD